MLLLPSADGLGQGGSGSLGLHDAAPHLCRPPARPPGLPFAHLMVRCRTWCMADTVFSQATCRGEDAESRHTGRSAPSPMLPEWTQPTNRAPAPRSHTPPTRRAEQRGLCAEQTTGNRQDCLARGRCLISISGIHLL